MRTSIGSHLLKLVRKGRVPVATAHVVEPLHEFLDSGLADPHEVRAREAKRKRVT
jgi:hypothetical protein